MCSTSTSISDRVRSELPLDALVCAVVCACRDATALTEGAFRTEESIRDTNGYNRKAQLNDRLLSLGESHPNLQTRLERNSGMLHHAVVESASFVVTPKFLVEPNGSLPRADYRQSMALAMPLFADLAEADEDDAKSYFVLVYSVDPYDPATPIWVALQDPGGQCVIDLSDELTAVLERDLEDPFDTEGQDRTVEEVVQPVAPKLRAQEQTGSGGA